MDTDETQILIWAGMETDHIEEFESAGVFDEAGASIPFCNPNVYGEAEDSGDDYSRGYKAGARLGLEFIGNFCRAIKNFDGDRGMAFDCALAAIGQWTILGVKDVPSLASRWGVTKAAINRTVVVFQEKLGIEDTMGVRSKQCRRAMSKARKKQLVG